MQYIMLPLDVHYDSGFGAIAESFRDAALALKNAVPKPAFFDHLPQSYLFRHATELFLKSEIVIPHRKLKLDYRTEPCKGAPMVLAQGEWKPIHRVHSIGALYDYWKSLINPRLGELNEMTKYKADWTIIDGADEWVKTIEGVDPRSTIRATPLSAIQRRIRPNPRSKRPPHRSYFRRTPPKDDESWRSSSRIAITNLSGDI
jgi:hypothetical protein